MWVIRSVTWALIIASYISTGFLVRQLRKLRKYNDSLTRDFLHMSVLALAARVKLHQVAPDQPPEVPEETARWMEEKHLEYMVYGDE